MTKTLYPSNLQLLNEIEYILAVPSAQAMDTDKLEACLRELQARAPIAEDYDAEQAWEQVQARLSDDAAVFSTRTHTRVFRLLIAGAAVLAALLISAAALGKASILQLIRWEEGKAIFQSIVSGDITERYNKVTIFDSLEAAFAEEPQTVDLLPTYLPDGFTLASVTRTQTLGAVHYAVAYTCTQGSIDLFIHVGRDDPAVYLVPKDAKAYPYYQNSIDFTVYETAGRWHALWQDGTVTYSLAVPSTEAELLNILHSIHR